MNPRISSYCRIKNKIIALNGHATFSGAELTFTDFAKQAYSFLECNYPKFFKMDSLCKLAFLNSELLLQNTGISQKYAADEIAVIICNSASSMDTDRKHAASISDKSNYFPSPSVFVYTLPNIMIGEICIRNNFKGENSFFIFDAFESEFMSAQVRYLFSNGRCKACIMGWVDYENEQDDALLCLIEESDNTAFPELTAINYSNLYS